MQISGISGVSHFSGASDNPFSQMKQLFKKVGTALESGDITGAKTAMAQLKKIAPPSDGNQENPVAAKMDELSKALDSGDLKTAQNAFASIQKAVSQRPPAAGGGSGPRGPRPSGPPPHGGGSKAKETSDSSSSTQTYDKMDTNKDGTVSAQEKAAYALKYPAATEEDAF